MDKQEIRKEMEKCIRTHTEVFQNKRALEIRMKQLDQRLQQLLTLLDRTEEGE